MSMRIQSLNADSSFILVFSPTDAHCDDKGRIPGSYTILLDPWLVGSSKVFSSKFAISNHSIRPCVQSLAELAEPDLVIISQDKTDHCHQETLEQLPKNSKALILGTPGAAKRIKSWKHFDPARVQSLKRYDDKREDSVYRIPIPPLSPLGSAGEVTVSLITAKTDLTGLHNAIGITYRSPSNGDSATKGSYLSLPLTPPSSPPESPDSISQRSTSSLPSQLGSRQRTLSVTSQLGSRQRTLSVIYSPHGVQYENLKSYASSHLLAEAALPLNALLHSFNRLSNPWYMGGTVCAGYPGGIEIAANLFAKVWISAHDEDKESSGVAVKALKVLKAELDQVSHEIRSLKKGRGSSCASDTLLLELGPGEAYFVPAR